MRLFLNKHMSKLIAMALFALFLAVYASRMAPSAVPGDPGEYQLIAAWWGIGHPPGYGFYALLGNLFTHLLPIGSFAWRANLLSAVCGAAIVTLAYLCGRMLSQQPADTLRGQAPPLLGALLLAAGLDLWQHAIHANAHIVTALLATLSLFLLLRWRHNIPAQAVEGREAIKQDGWLLAFCVMAGLSPAHHPLLVFAFPAYAAFIIAVRPRILKDWRTLLKMVACALLGLAAFLYYPIRCAIGGVPEPGPSDMNTWAGFIRVITAQGLRVNLFQFTPMEILYRLLDVRVPLGLQYMSAALALAGLGGVMLWTRRWRPALLLTGYLACVVLVTVNILQDEMAYLLGPMVVVGVWAGLGVDVLMGWLARWRAGVRYVLPLLIIGVSLMPAWTAAVNWTRMDLSNFDDANRWLEMVEERFVGKGEHAVLLTEWERMTTVWYYRQVEGRAWDPADLQFVLVPAGQTFARAIDENLAKGPVYLNGDRRLGDDRYRLMPSKELWQALPAWPRELPAEAIPANMVAENQFEIVGWRMDKTTASPGDVLNLDLYMRMAKPEGVEAQRFYLPWARLGDVTYHFTTDSRFNTPWWQPGEIVVERFELPVSWKAEAGVYPLQIGVQLINENRELSWQDDETLAQLTTIEIGPAAWQIVADKLDAALGNLRGEILLRNVRVNGKRLSPGKTQVIKRGSLLRVTLDWEALRPIDENYTVFVQLLDWNSWPPVKAQDDITPLGGSAPTLLWFPRWRQGMRIADTHLLALPDDLQPGLYPLVAGMYGFNTRKRVQNVLPDGDVEGDWITLGNVQVE